MRIITGSARGALIETLEGENTRPTAERAKEALFSMLQFEIEGRKILDLFAGSGQLGLEAISRGAESCTFIDSAREATDLIIKNAKNAKLFDKSKVSSIDFKSFLRGAKDKYDIIFLDPPYASDYVYEALKMINENDLLAYGGKIVCETDNGLVNGKKKKISREEDIEKAASQIFRGDEDLKEKYSIARTAVYSRIRITLLEAK